VLFESPLAALVMVVSHSLGEPGFAPASALTRVAGPLTNSPFSTRKSKPLP